MRWLAAGAKAVAILLCAGVLVFGSARAANTIVTALVCSPTVGSVITLYRPVSDSIVNDPNITVSGKASQAGSVDILVDGIHRTTLTTDTLNQSFSTIVTVNEGTHQITLMSNDICHVQNGTASAVVTYYAAASPSQGTTVPTVTQPLPATRVTGDGLPVYDSHLTLPKSDMDYTDGLVHGVIDESQPVAPLNAAPGIVAIPFVVGAGAFGWIHFRRLGH